MKGIIQCVIFCDKLLSPLFSSFIHIVADISTSFLFVTNCIPLYCYITLYLSIHQLMDISVIAMLGLFFKIYLLVLFGCQAPNQGLNWNPLHWEHGVSATGPPGKSPFWGYFE